MALRIGFSSALLFVSLFVALIQRTVALEERDTQIMIFRNPVALIHSQGTLTYPAHKNINLQWDSTRSPLNCDVYQGPDEHGVITVQEVFRTVPNTTNSFPWFARNLGNVTAGSPMHFSLYWAENSTCNHCSSNTTSFTLVLPDKPSDKALPIGLGVGLGVGIPIILLAVFLTWFFMKRRHRKALAAQSAMSPTSHQMSPCNPFESASPVTTLSHPATSLNASGYGPISSTGYSTEAEAKTPIAEADGGAGVAELPPGDVPQEAGQRSPRAELMGDSVLKSPQEKR